MNKFKQFLTEVAAAQDPERRQTLNEGLLRDKMGELRSLLQELPSLDPTEYSERVKEVSKFLSDAAEGAQDKREAQELYDYAFDSLMKILNRITQARSNKFKEAIGDDLDIIEYVLNRSGLRNFRYSDIYEEARIILEATDVMLEFPNIIFPALCGVAAIQKEFLMASDILESLRDEGAEDLQLPDRDLSRLTESLGMAERLLKGEGESSIGLEKIKELVRTDEFKKDLESLFTHYYRKPNY